MAESSRVGHETGIQAIGNVSVDKVLLTHFFDQLKYQARVEAELVSHCSNCANCSGRGGGQ